MSVTTRTNRATNPSAKLNAAEYLSVAGTGGTASGAHVAGSPGFDDINGLYRVTWTVGTSSSSGGATYFQETGISASTTYTLSMYVKPSKEMTLRLNAQYRNSSGANTNNVVSAGSVCPPGVWTRLYVSATSNSSTAQLMLKCEATGGSAFWANGDTLEVDGVLIETGSQLRHYFDGDYADAAGNEYTWAGTAHSSNSLEQLYTPALTLLHLSDDPCDRVEITITDLQPQESYVTLWRIADGKRRAVRSYENVAIVGSDFTTDYEVPLGRLTTYELEIISGPGLGSAPAPVSITVEATSGWIQDPLDPGSAVRLHALDPGETGELTLQDDAIKQLEMPAEVSLIQVLGDSEPVALMGQRMAQRGIPFSLATNAAQAATDIRNLIQQTPLLLVRPLPEWASALPGLCYVAPPTPVEMPVTEAWGGSLIKWKFDTGLVKPPSMDLVIPLWTYQDWQDLWTTYQQAQSALSGDTYLQVKKSPTGA